MIKLFTACDLGYFWHAAHLISSAKKNAENVPLCLFIVNVTDVELSHIVQLVSELHDKATVIPIAPPDEITGDKLIAWCAGVRTFIMGMNDLRNQFFESDDTLVWLDADSIIRKPIESFLEFIQNNDFDMAARGKNDDFKYASGVVVQKPTTPAQRFGSRWHQNWGALFGEWTADQNAFNQSSYELKDSVKVQKLPKKFCDVWLSEEGVIWQAKHQTKQIKRYTDEMSQYVPEPKLDNSLWDAVVKCRSPIVIDSASFIHAGLDFKLLGFEGEETFEHIKTTKNFYNVEFLEKIVEHSLYEGAAIYNVGIHMGSSHIFLTTFTNCVLNVGFEPTGKVIDLVARNQRANPYIEHRAWDKKCELSEHLTGRGIKQNFYLSCINWPHVTLDQEVSVLSCGSSKQSKRWSRAVSYNKEQLNDWLFSDGYKKSRTFEYLETSDEDFASLGPTTASHSLRFGTSTLDIVHRDAKTQIEIFSEGVVVAPPVGLIYIDLWDPDKIFDVLDGAESILWEDDPSIAIVVHSAPDMLVYYKNKLQSTLGNNYKLVVQLPDALNKESTCLLYAAEEKL